MSKYLMAFYFVLLLLWGCQNSKSIVEENEVINSSLNELSRDTLLIKESNKIEDPFLFGEKPLKYLLNEIKVAPTSIEVIQDSDSIENENGVNEKRVLGSIYNLRYDMDYFKMYRRADSVEFFVTTEIKTENFVTKWGVKVGMTKKDVMNKLSQFRLDSLPTTMIIGDLEYTFIQFDFKDEKLYKIYYDHYLD